MGFAELEYFLGSQDDAFLIVLDPDGQAPELPVARPQALRLRFHAPEVPRLESRDDVQPFDEGHAEYTLRFLASARPMCKRFVVCSPHGEVRGPGLALGLADLLRLPEERIARMEDQYRRHSRAIRKALWQAAYPPEPVASRPEVKAASGILAFLARYLSS